MEIPTLLETEYILAAPGYEVSAIFYNDRVWLRLSNNSNLVRFWSSQKRNQEIIPYQHIKGQLVQRLLEANPEPSKIDTMLKFWPEGWDFWGGGTPYELSNYFRDGYYHDQKEIIKSNILAARLLRLYDDNDPLKPYYATIISLFVEAKLLRTKSVAWGFFLILKQSIIYLKNGLVLGEGYPFLGSVDNIANVMSVLFPSISNDPEWWNQQYELEINSSSTLRSAKQIIATLRQFDEIKQIISYLP